MASILIKNGLVTDSSSMQQASLLIEDGKISRFEAHIEESSCPFGTRVVDARGLIVMPGLIDAHTHYHLVSRGTVTCDSFIQGSRLASFGGVTTVVDFADHNKGMGLVDSANFRLDEMKPGMAIDYTIHQGVYGHGYDSTIGKQLEDLKKMGIKTLKIFTTYRNTGYLIENRENLLDLFKNAKRLGLMVCAHCEFNPMIEELSNNWNGDFSPSSHAKLRPAEAEGKAIDLFGGIALEANCPLYVVHVSSKCGLDAVRRLRAKGLEVYVETTPHYLFLDRSKLEGSDASLYVMTPPLRDKSDNTELQKAVVNGEVQVIATDHCAFTREQKLSSSDCRTIYPGIPGTEEMFVLLNTFRDTVEEKTSDKFPFTKLVELMSTSPAKLFGLYPNKGSLEIGTDADLVLFNHNISWTLEDSNVHSASLYTPYRGFNVRGKVVMTILRGDVIMENGEYYGVPGNGKFLRQC